MPPDRQTALATIRGLFTEFLSMPNDSTAKIVSVAVALCLVCALIVSTVAVVLKPQQILNKAMERKRNILAVAGISDPDKGVDELFGQIQAKVVDIKTGEYVETIDVDSYDQRRAARDPARSIKIPAEQDIARVRAQAKYATLYLVRDGDEIKKIILPVRGYGLWSTLYGFIALEDDANTISALSFYEHFETPGLGGEVDNPRWKALWRGKQVFDDTGNVRIEVAKGLVDKARPEAIYQVDGLAGATLTARGVTNLLRFWLGQNGFGPYLEKMKSERG